MKATSRPFKSRHDSGRCPLCKKRIVKGQVIQRLETTATWNKEELSSRGKINTRRCFADYVHAKCLEERDA